MNKNIYIVIIITFLLPLFLPPTTHSFFNRDVKMAKNFMKAGMYIQAISLLEKRINESPTDAEAHFQLGVCYTVQDNFQLAEKRFDSAVRLNPEYGYKIGPLFMNSGKRYLENDSIQNAKASFIKCKEYQPDLKNEIAGLYFNKGIEKFKQFESDMADMYFSQALLYNPNLSSDIQDASFKYAKRLLAIGKNEILETKRENYRREASKYLDTKSIKKILPNQIESYQESYTFYEQSETWCTDRKYKIGEEISIDVSENPIILTFKDSTVTVMLDPDNNHIGKINEDLAGRLCLKSSTEIPVRIKISTKLHNISPPYIEIWEEKFFVNKSDEIWALSHYVQKGVNLIAIIEMASIVLKTNDNDERVLKPGTHQIDIKETSNLTFKGLDSKAKVLVRGKYLIN